MELSRQIDADVDMLDVARCEADTAQKRANQEVDELRTELAAAAMRPEVEKELKR